MRVRARMHLKWRTRASACVHPCLCPPARLLLIFYSIVPLFMFKRSCDCSALGGAAHQVEVSFLFRAAGKMVSTLRLGMR
jgi:hypothetical protein